MTDNSARDATLQASIPAGTAAGTSMQLSVPAALTRLAQTCLFADGQLEHHAAVVADLRTTPTYGDRLALRYIESVRRDARKEVAQ